MNMKIILAKKHISFYFGVKTTLFEKKIYYVIKNFINNKN
jgi:hypothetical protein